MNLLTWSWLLWRYRRRRYQHLFRTIRDRRAARLVEIGVWDGHHAGLMIRTAGLGRPAAEVSYAGFDLWEELTDELFRAEASKKPPTRAEVQARLEKTGARIELVMGNTRHTLPASAELLKAADFIFIDGGHSVETVRSDWAVVESCLNDRAVVIFDDYYVGTEPELAGIGCQSVIDGLDRGRFRVELLDPMEEFRKPWGTLRIRMARVARR